MASIADLWPVAGSVTVGPGIFWALYKWVIRQLLSQVTLSNKQRDEADSRANVQQLRADGLQGDVDKVQDKLDLELAKRRESDRLLAVVTSELAGCKQQLADLLAENARLRNP